MAWNPVETIDYIFDRYAFLGLETSATLKEIRAAIRAKRAENHPDRLVKVGLEAKATAEQVTQRLTECAEMLLNEQRKAHFDVKLAWFKEHRPRAISESGIAIVVLDEQHFELPVLLGQSEGGRHSEVLEHARQLSHFNPERTAKLRRMYEASGGDSDVKAMLLEALHAELAYYDALEEDAWQQLGIANKKEKIGGHLVDTEDYSLMSVEELDRVVEEDLPNVLGETLGLTRLGLATPLLLLGGPDKPNGLPARLEDVTVDHLMAQAKTVLDGKRAMMREAAERKQAVLEELSSLHDITWLTELPRRRGAFTILLMHARNDGEEPVAIVAIECHDDSANTQGGMEHPAIGQTTQAIMALALSRDTLAITMDPEAGAPLMMVGPAIRFRRKEMGLEAA